MTNSDACPAPYGLPKRTVLEEYNGGIALVIDRKSRLVMADGRRILEKVLTLREQVGDTPVVLKTTAPVCSKTKLFLAEQGLTIISPVLFVLLGSRTNLIVYDSPLLTTNLFAVSTSPLPELYVKSAKVNFLALVVIVSYKNFSAS